MEKLDTQNKSNQNLGTDKSQKKEDRKELQQLLIQLTEDKVEQKFLDKYLDRENEKIQLINGDVLSRRQIKENIQNKARTYKPMYPLVFYREIYRLFGWAESEASVYFKKWEVAIFTREVIYGRFDKGVLMSLHVLNPYTRYISRRYKHFQFLTDDGLEKLNDIISQAIEMMKGCDTMYEFRKKWYSEHGVPYQMSAFTTA